LLPQGSKPDIGTRSTFIQQTGSRAKRWGALAVIAVLAVTLVILLLNNANRADFAGGSGTPVEALSSPTVAAIASEATTTPMPTFGTLSFSTAHAVGDTVTLRLENLRQPPTGRVYIAWLQSPQASNPLKLGQVRIDALGNGALVFTDPSKRNLAILFNAVIITAEQNSGDAPAQQASYSGSVPETVAQALNEILVTSSIGIVVKGNVSTSGYGSERNVTGTQAGLLDSALFEARIAQQHAGLAAASNSAAAMHSHAEHTINILLGTQVDYDGNGRRENPGMGLGVLLFSNKIEEQLGQAISQGSPDRNRTLKYNAELIRICLINVHNWLDQVVGLEKQLLASGTIETIGSQAAKAQQITSALTDGVDLNNNGQVEPFEGECGLQQVSTYSLLLTSINIYEGSLPP
jgi:hypothetical protein